MKKIVILSLMIFAMSLCITPGVKAQYGIRGSEGPSVEAVIPPVATPLSEYWRGTVQGDYVAAGVGMRNIGSGDINITLPPGSTIHKALLYWAVIMPITVDGEPQKDNFINNVAPPKLNGTPITSTHIGTAGVPCWIGDVTVAFRADVTNIAVDGVNTLTDFPSGRTDNSHPGSDPLILPLLEGATLVVVFTNPNYDLNTVVVRDGAVTFSGPPFIFNDLGNYTAVVGSNPADQIAATTYIMADGQANGQNDQAAFNFVITAGPGSAPPLKTADAFDGADGHANVDPVIGLWDTLNVDVSSFFPPAAAQSAIAGVSSQIDCLTWCAQVLSVKTTQVVAFDIKPTSCPNPLSTKKGGVIPVAILGTDTLDVNNIDTNSILLEGVAPLRFFFKDVATPVTNKTTGCGDCWKFYPDPEFPDEPYLGDGYTDLTLKFSAKDLVAALGTLADGECVDLTLTGTLLDGSPIEGSDHMVVIKK
jgi:hypothetical protein